MSLDLQNIIESVQFNDFLFDNITSSIIILDKNLRVKKVNLSYKNLFCKDETDVLSQLCGDSLGCSFAVEQGKPCGTTSECGSCMLRQSAIKALAESGNIQSAYITREFYIEGKPHYKYFHIKTKGIRYHNEDMAILTVDDVTELEEQKRHIEEMANRDYLTGLFNRRYLYDCGEKIFQNAKRGSINLAVVMIDIDHFKKINDTHGHDAGDFILVSLSDMLTTALRQADIITRLGGEEFCILLNVAGLEDAFGVIEKIRLLVAEKKFIYKKTEIPMTISCGITAILEASLEDMIKKADQMLYEAKTTGRNKVLIYK